MLQVSFLDPPKKRCRISYRYQVHESGPFLLSAQNQKYQSYLYRIIVEYNGLEHSSELEYYEWPRQIYDLPTQNWVDAYNEFVESDAFERYPSPADIGESLNVHLEDIMETIDD